MTEWQWQVLCALIRVVLKIGSYQGKDESLLLQALSRDKDANTN